MRAGVYLPLRSARGGAERLCLLLALELAESGNDVVFFTSAGVDVAELERDLGESLRSLRFEPLPRPPGPDRLPRAVAGLALDRSHARHIASFDLDLFVNGLFKSRLPGVARWNVLYCHFPYPLEVTVDGALRRRYMRLVESAHRRFVAGRPDGFLGTYDEVWANSRFTAGHVAARWGRQAQVLYPPCPLHTRSHKEPVVLSVGRFQAPDGTAPYKAQDRLIEAFGHLAELHPTWRLELVGGFSGTPADTRYLDTLRGLAADLPVTLRPNCSFADLDALYGRASLYWHAQGFGADLRLNPGGAEHFGISTVEAMSAGAFPLVFDAAGPAEVVAPLPGSRWRTLEELVELTHRWMSASLDEQRHLADRSAARAEEFDRAHFRRALGERLGTRPGGPPVAS